MKAFKTIWWSAALILGFTLLAFSNSTDQDGKISIRDGIDGRNGSDGNNGKDGKDGKDGADGKDGIDGETTIIYVPQEPITSMPAQVEPPIEQPSSDWTNNSINTGQGGSVTHIVVTQNNKDKPLNFERVK